MTLSTLSKPSKQLFLMYLEYHFTVEPVQPWSDILMAELGEIGFESFVETATGLIAYVQESDFHNQMFNSMDIFRRKDCTINWTLNKIQQQNWNAEWEKNFKPIKVGSTCMVRAPFHQSENVKYDIIIEPKMSFGTGHHETTHMMLQHILENDFKNKTVLDMGCGTGVLAILAKMKGATSVDAIDVDEWCFLNTKENVTRNDCAKINVFQGDKQLVSGKKYDIILANINRNTLLQDIPDYSKSLNLNGALFLSGFYLDDLNAISSKCEASGLKYEKKLEKNHWVSAKYVN